MMSLPYWEDAPSAGLKPFPLRQIAHIADLYSIGYNPA